MSAPSDSRASTAAPTVTDKSGLSPLSALGMSALIFLLIPIAQKLATSPFGPQEIMQTAQLAPPELLEELPPPPPPEEEFEEPELEEAPPPPSIEALDFLLNPDVSGIASADMRLPDVEMDRRALTDLDIFEISDLDDPPGVVFSSAPQYPESMRRAGIGGRVIMRFVVDEEGRARDIIVEASPNPAFDRPAIDAVRQWRFTIGKKNGRAVKFRMRLPMVFDASAF